MTITVPEAFLAAADKIEECGWIRHAFGDSASGFCAAGALQEVTLIGLHFLDQATADEWREVYLNASAHGAATVRKKFFGTGWVALSHYNDADGRTKEEVVALLRECAASYPEVSDGRE